MITGQEVVDYAKFIGTGRPYVLGATGPAAYDCSGLVLAVLQHFYLAQFPNFPREAGAQARWLGVNGKQVPVAVASVTPGAILAIDVGPSGSGAGGNHIGFCLSPGISFEARSTGYGIGSWPLSQHKWTGGYLIPKVNYTPKETYMPTQLVRKTSTGEIAFFIEGRVVHSPTLTVESLNELMARGLVDSNWTELSDAAFDALPT